MRNLSRSPRFKALGVSAAAALTLCTSVLSIQPAQAQTQSCKDLPNPLYLSATTLLESLMLKVGPVLADSAKVGTDQMTVVYFPNSSCDVYGDFKNKKVLTGTAKYYKDGKEASCELTAADNITPDLAAMDVGGKTCLGVEPPKELKEVPSHVETLGFVVPKSSNQTAITATEAYYLMKFAGAQGKAVSPWNDPKFVFVRNPGSSTQLTVGANINFSGKIWPIADPNNPASTGLQGNKGSGQVRDKVNAQNGQPAAQKTIGILNSSKWEAAKNTMKVLAFQAFNQCIGAVYPDSTPEARDKINVRDGHYPIWTNLRYVKRVDAAGKTTGANAARVDRFLALMTGAASNPKLPVTKFVVQTGNIPSCAMKVKRDVDGGPISSFDHPAPCHCSFLKLNNITDPTCKACTDNSTCGTGKCREGFCEAR